MLKIFQGNIMFGSSRKKLIAIGCSYTNYERHGTHWPEFLAEHLDMKVVNLGMPGRGNSYMFSILQDVLMLNKFTLSESKHFRQNLSAAAKPYQLHQLINSWPKRTEFNIKNEDIGLVVIMWSEFQRMDFESKRFWLSFHPHRNDWKYEKYPLEKAGRDVMVQWNNVFSATLLSMRHFHLSQLLLKDIPYIFVQGTKPTVTPTNAHDRDLIPERYVKRSSYDRDGLVSFERISSRAIINSNYFDLIDDKKFLGWPIHRELGGFCVEDILDKLDPDQRKYRIGNAAAAQYPNDTHPNREGHKVIASKLYEEYKKIYL